LLVAALTPLEVVLAVATVAPADPVAEAVELVFTEPVVTALLLTGEDTAAVPEGVEASMVRCPVWAVYTGLERSVMKEDCSSEDR
jgi:hypothetical protein